MRKLAFVIVALASLTATAAEAGWPVWHPIGCADGYHAVRTPNGGQRCIPN